MHFELSASAINGATKSRPIKLSRLISTFTVASCTPICSHTPDSPVLECLDVTRNGNIVRFHLPFLIRSVARDTSHL